VEVSVLPLTRNLINVVQSPARLGYKRSRAIKKRKITAR